MLARTLDNYSRVPNRSTVLNKSTGSNFSPKPIRVQGPNNRTGFSLLKMHLVNLMVIVLVKLLFGRSIKMAE